MLRGGAVGPARTTATFPSAAVRSCRDCGGGKHPVHRGLVGELSDPFGKVGSTCVLAARLLAARGILTVALVPVEVNAFLASIDVLPHLGGERPSSPER